MITKLLQKPDLGTILLEVSEAKKSQAPPILSQLNENTKETFSII